MTLRCDAALPIKDDAMRDALEAQWLVAVAAGGAKGTKRGRSCSRLTAQRMLRLFHRLRMAPAVSEDLMQDVMVTLYEKAGHYRAGLPVEPWVRAIALNKLRSWVSRHDQKMVERRVDDEPPAELVDPSAEWSAVPADVILACRRRCWRAFAEARPRAAMALQLCHAEGWSVAELAEFLGLTEGSAKGFIHEERRNARAALEPCEPGPRGSKIQA